MPKPIRPIRIEGNLAYAPLTQGKEAIIDAADVHLVEGVNWFARKDKMTFYAVRSEKTSTGQKQTRMHRVIMGDPVEMQIDHKDGNGLNNRRTGEHGNLRVASHAENNRNRSMHRRNTSGFKGVSWKKSDSTWVSNIGVSGKLHRLGTFDTPEEAYAAYCEAAVRLHGSFARLK